MKQPTEKQLEAWYWTHIVGLSNEEAGERIGITTGNVRKRLHGFFEIRIELKPEKGSDEKIKNAIRCCKIRDCDIDHKF